MLLQTSYGKIPSNVILNNSKTFYFSTNSTSNGLYKIEFHDDVDLNTGSWHKIGVFDYYLTIFRTTLVHEIAQPLPFQNRR